MIKFGPSGNDEIFYSSGETSSATSCTFLKTKMNLDAFEISFGRGINIGDEMIKKIRDDADKNGILVSVHAPYYINFANDELYEKNVDYIKRCIKIVKQLGGNHIVVHSASEGTLGRKNALEATRKNLIKLLKEISTKEFLGVYLCLEVMGRYKAIGTPEEIAELCNISDIFIPCIDFGHVYCLRQGDLSTKEQYLEILNKMADIATLEKIRKCHIHFSKIKFNNKGEMAHLSFDNGEWGPPHVPFIEALKEFKHNGVVICESKNSQARDAKVLKEIYYS